jgi:hypothetical protein
MTPLKPVPNISRIVNAAPQQLPYLCRLPQHTALAMPAGEICRRIVRHKTFQRTALPY